MNNTLYTRAVNWFEEELDTTYNDDNDGYIYGIYLYDGEDVIDVQWYKTEQERAKDLIND